MMKKLCTERGVEGKAMGAEIFEATRIAHCWKRPISTV